MTKKKDKIMNKKTLKLMIKQACNNKKKQKLGIKNFNLTDNIQVIQDF